MNIPFGRYAENSEKCLRHFPNPNVSDRSLVRKIQGPAAGAVGFIERLPPGDQQTLRGAMPDQYRNVVDLMLVSGNCQPPNQIASDADYERLVAAKEYRAAIRLSDVEFHLNRAGDVVETDLRLRSQVGFTPVDVGKKRFFSSGIGSSDADVLYTERGIVIRAWVSFRIGWPGRLTAKLLTGQRVSPAMIEIQYSIGYDGTISQRFFASLVPSVAVYVDGWQRGQSSCTACASHLLAFLSLDGKRSPIQEIPWA